MRGWAGTRLRQAVPRPVETTDRPGMAYAVQTNAGTLCLVSGAAGSPHSRGRPLMRRLTAEGVQELRTERVVTDDARVERALRDLFRIGGVLRPLKTGCNRAYTHPPPKAAQRHFPPVCFKAVRSGRFVAAQQFL